MKRTESPFDPEITAQLDAIDATLAGDPVDPEHAELAELALLLAAGRPQIEPGFAAALDDRVQRRFVARPEPEGAVRRRRWSPVALGGFASAAVAAVVVVVVVSSGGGGSPRLTAISTPAAGTATSAASSSATVGSAAASSAALPALRPSARKSVPTFAPQPLSLNSLAASPAAAPQPPTNGRKIIQSANLALSASSSRIDAVAQEVFDVVGREQGIVNSSQVTAASDGYAQFHLSIPSGNLTDTMTALSQLRYARVASRTDSTQDVNGQYVSANRRLADDRALRTSLLKQLANATTQAQVDSLNGQIHDAEAAIARDESDLRSLNNQINYSQVEVTIGAGVLPVARGHSSSSFTLGKAAHDAGRVLTVAAGVALITLAALVPVLLVAGLAWWIAAAMRRRRREQALDMA